MVHERRGDRPLLHRRRRSAHHARRPLPAPHQHRRTAAAVERAARRHEPGRTAAGPAGAALAATAPHDWALRCSVRPGITGLAQATLRSRGDARAAARALDLRYVREHSAVAATCASSRWTVRPPHRQREQLMCGIFGYWDRERQRAGAEQRWRAMAAVAACIAARTTRASGSQPGARRGCWATGACPSSTSRGGHQPFVSDDGQVALVQNGEIFNYVELAAELRAQGVPAAHAAPTPRCCCACTSAKASRFLRRLNGMFAIAIDDAREDALYLVRDRIGVKPLYWRDDGGAGAVRLRDQGAAAGRCARGAAPAIDLEAIHHYLTFNYIPAPWTIWQGIRHVMPGTWMKFTRTRRADAALVEPGGRSASGTTPSSAWSEEFLAVARRRHPHPPARRRALGRLPVRRRRLEHHRRPDGAPRAAAGAHLLHRLRRSALRRVAVRGARRRDASAASTPARSPS